MQLSIYFSVYFETCTLWGTIISKVFGMTPLQESIQAFFLVCPSVYFKNHSIGSINSCIPVYLRIFRFPLSFKNMIHQTRMLFLQNPIKLWSLSSVLALSVYFLVSLCFVHLTTWSKSFIFCHSLMKIPFRDKNLIKPRGLSN